MSPLALDTPRLSAGWVEEPGLRFADDHEHVDPKTGIPLYGPRSLGTFRHKREVHVGIIGTSESADFARRYYEQASDGVDGDDGHAPFPGCRADRGFRCDLVFDGKLVELVTRSEHQDILGIKKGRDRFEKLLLTLELKLRLLTQKDQPLDCIVFACRPTCTSGARPSITSRRGSATSTVTCGGRSRRWRCSTRSRRESCSTRPPG